MFKGKTLRVFYKHFLAKLYLKDRESESTLLYEIEHKSEIHQRYFSSIG